MANDILLEIKGLHASVGDKEILKGIDLVIRKGEIHAVMGPNGAGKSTLSSVLTGKPLYTVTEGSITFMGKDLLAMSPEERSWAGIFMSFQYPIEIPGVTITNFMKTAVNAKRAAEGLEPMKAGDFLKLMKEKMAFVQMRPEFAKREVNVGFSAARRSVTRFSRWQCWTRPFPFWTRPTAVWTWMPSGLWQKAYAPCTPLKNQPLS